MTGNTEPDGRALQDFVFQSELDGTHDLARAQIHSIINGATGTAFAALVAVEDFLTALAFYKGTQVTQRRWINTG